MTRPISWSLPISGSGPAAFSAVTVIFRVTEISGRLADLMLAAETSLVTMAVVAVAVWSPACFSAQTHRCRIQHRMLSLPHFISPLQYLVLATTSVTRELGFLRMGISWPSTSPLSRQRCRRETVKCTTDRSRATCATNTWCCLPTSNMHARFSIHRWPLCHLRPIHSTELTVLTVRLFLP